MEQARKAFAEQPASPDVRDRTVGDRIAWPVTGIVRALQDAAACLSQDCRTFVEAATAWITARRPDARPEHKGFRTWRQQSTGPGCSTCKTVGHMAVARLGIAHGPAEAGLPEAQVAQAGAGPHRSNGRGLAVRCASIERR